MFDVFISVESSFFVGREPPPVFRRRTAISDMLQGDSLPDKINFATYGFLTNRKFPPDQAAVRE